MIEPPRWVYGLSAAALLMIAVFIVAKAYIPSVSGYSNIGNNPFLGKSEPWSKGASLDPRLATAGAGCFVASVFCFRAAFRR